MIHIAVCDDNSAAIERIVRLLQDYRREKQIPISWHTFFSAAEMVASMQSAEYDLLLLDILMPGVSGMDAAREIRTFDQGVKIIFLTTSPDYAVEGYAVNASDYLLKPVSRERIFRALDRVVAEGSSLSKGIHIKTTAGVAKIPYVSLCYVEVRDKLLYFHLADGSVRTSRASLAEYEPLLLYQKGFFKVHRAYIVNFRHMTELTADSFCTRTGQTVPVSRLLYSQVRQAYIDDLFAEAETLA